MSICVSALSSLWRDFYASAALARRGDRAFGLYVHPSKRLRFLSKVESQDLLQRCNGSKLIFHLRMYFYETSRNILEL